MKKCVASYVTNGDALGNNCANNVQGFCDVECTLNVNCKLNQSCFFCENTCGEVKEKKKQYSD